MIFIRSVIIYNISTIQQQQQQYIDNNIILLCTQSRGIKFQFHTLSYTLPR